MLDVAIDSNWWIGFMCAFNLQQVDLSGIFSNV